MEIKLQKIFPVSREGLGEDDRRAGLTANALDDRVDTLLQVPPSFHAGKIRR